MHKYTQMYKKWDINKYDVLIFLSIFIVGAVLRFYKIQDIATFGHDNSRDLIVTYKLFLYKELIWRGPVFSIIWAHLNLLYYYIIFPFYYILNFRPLSGPIFTASVNLITLIILSIVTAKIFGKKIAVSATLIYAVSFLVVKESTFGLNPCLVPPFTILLFYSVYKIINNEEKFLKLLSFTLFGMLSFHPSGIFIIPILAIFYAIYRPKFKLKTLLISGAIFTSLVLIPYGVQEKKFQLYDVKQVVSYVKTIGNNQKPVENKSESAPTADLTPNNQPPIINFFVVLLKNISNTLFGYNNLVTMPTSAAIIIAASFYGIKIFKKNQKPATILCGLLILYIIPLGFLIKFHDTGERPGWFQPVIIPYIVIFCGYLINKFYSVKLKQSAFLILLIIVFTNIYAISNYKTKEDSYSYVRYISKFIEADSNGLPFDIIGIKPQAHLYILWHESTDSSAKERYFSQIKWDKELGAPLIYYIEQKDPLTKAEADQILTTHHLNNFQKILTTPYGGVYRFK